MRNSDHALAIDFDDSVTDAHASPFSDASAQQTADLLSGSRSREKKAHVRRRRQEGGRNDGEGHQEECEKDMKEKEGRVCDGGEREKRVSTACVSEDNVSCCSWISSLDK